MKKKTFFLLPQQKTKKKNFQWPGLEVKQSSLCQELGVFTTTTIKKGALIPILGHGLTEHDLDEIQLKKKQSTHIWIYTNNTLANGFPAIDGHPNCNTSGLNIAMMINEDFKKKPNCIFKSNFILVTKTLPPNTELTVFYGEDYCRQNYYSNNHNCESFKSYCYDCFQLPRLQERTDCLNFWMAKLCLFEFCGE